MSDSDTKIIRPIQPDEPEIKQQKPKSPSPLITEIKLPKPGTEGQVAPKKQSEPIPPIKPKA
jgi:hypothetical protein